MNYARIAGWLLLVGSGSLFAQVPGYAKCKPLPLNVEAFISASTNKIRGYESCRERQIKTGRVNPDKLDDIVVVFHIEGPCYKDETHTPGGCSNGYVTFLSVFLGPDYKKAATFQVGSKGNRSIQVTQLKEGVIYAQTKDMIAGDAMCCPSHEGKTRFIYIDGALTEATK